MATLALIARWGSTIKDDVPPMDKSGTAYHIEASAAGTYETAGPDGRAIYPSGAPRPCNWTLLGPNCDGKTGIEDEYDAFIAKDDNVTGRTRVTVKADEYFLSYGCEPWRYVG